MACGEETHPVAQRRAILVNERGLHARASYRVMQLIEGYTSNSPAVVTLSLQRETEEGDVETVIISEDSILDLILLCAAKGMELHISVQGENPDILADALKDYIDQGFGEVF